jgi:hypothetical protein
MILRYVSYLYRDQRLYTHTRKKASEAAIIIYTNDLVGHEYYLIKSAI